MLIKETERLGTGRGVDVVGAVLVTVALMLGVYAIVKASEYGWISAHTLGFGGAALALLAVFVAVESRLTNPMFPLRILRVPGLAASSVVRGFLVTGMFSTFLLGVLYLQHVHGYGALRTGLAFLPLTLVLGLMSVGDHGAPDGAVRTHAGAAGRAGGDHRRASRCSRACRRTRATCPAILGPFVLLGLGAGLSFLPLTTMAMAEVPIARRRAGLRHRQRVTPDLGRDRHRGAGDGRGRAHQGAGRPGAAPSAGAHRRDFTWPGRSAPARWRSARWSRSSGCALRRVRTRSIRLEEHEPVELQLEAA